MTELNLENIITNYLDTIYIISHSQGSVDSYRFAINHFKKFVQHKYEKSLEQIIFEIKNNSLDKYQIFQNFVIYLDKAGKKPSSIKIWVMGAKGFLKHCGIKLYNEDFKMAVKLPKRVHQREEPLTKEIILRLLNNVSAKLRTIILVATASGMRIGEILQLKLSDMGFDSRYSTADDLFQKGKNAWFWLNDTNGVATAKLLKTILLNELPNVVQKLSEHVSD